MATPNTLRPERRCCPRCGTEQAPDHPAGPCPKCLLQAGLGSSPAAGAVSATVAVAPGQPDAAFPTPGELFGHYRIVRRLGRGGMGAVFEAEDQEAGRRVALKILSHALDSPEARARFLREGRLAASVNHPNSVYVFGTEEVAGTPVIAMELVGGGTLEGRVKARGPLPTGEAVEAVLQVIAGLEAAQRLGVLHRDVKPSNCFVDTDGTIKVGDFGLSISTTYRSEPLLTAVGTFLGTPAFCSPEQLRGDELTVRSDIYAVGVTLYYLLTARLPFEAPNPVQLLATVLERPPASPATHRADLPGGLCRVVLRCLEKDAGERYPGYAELRTALLPYSASAPAPAPLATRFLAGWVDALILCLPGYALVMAGARTSQGLVGAAGLSHPWFWVVQITNAGALIVYYALLEGCWGRSLGKAVCGLRVVRADRTVPGVGAGLVRALVFAVPPSLPVAGLWLCLPAAAEMPANGLLPALTGLLPLLVTGLAFLTTARRRNGFAAWHDWVSRTRVVVLPAVAERPPTAADDDPVPDTAATPALGPYFMLREIGQGDGTALHLGFDPRLLRRVWLRTLPDAAEPVDAIRRGLSRPGRLRWLNGRRRPGEAWDAYEALAGQPLTSRLGTHQPWARVRFWLHDLATELHAAELDGSLPTVLDIDRVWITADGRAKLLDFAVPGAEAPTDAVPTSAAGLLRRVAAFAGATDAATAVTPARPVACPLPLHARGFLERLAGTDDLATILAEAKPLLTRRPEVTRRRRLLLLAGCAVFPAAITVMVLAGLLTVRALATRHADILPLCECVAHLTRLDRQVSGGQPDLRPQLEAFEAYTLGRFAPLISDPAVWNSYGLRLVITAPQRAVVERVLAKRGPPTPGELAAAAETVRRVLGRSPEESGADAFRALNPLPIALLMGYFNTVVVVFLPCLLAALLFRGGLLWQFVDVALVTRHGDRASRWRVAWRNTLAWLPFLAAPFVGLALARPLGGVPAALLVTAGLGAAAVACAWTLERSPHDRLAGTFLVPR